MSSTSFITLPFLIKFWILGLMFYVIRKTSSEFKVRPRNELCWYIAVSIAIFASQPLFGISILGGNGKDMAMTRQESDLVKDYLRNRADGETLGTYLARLEAEEEQLQREQEYVDRKILKIPKPSRKKKVAYR